MNEEISDLDLQLVWGRTGEQLKVYHKGRVVYNSITGYADTTLSERQVKWIDEDFHRKKKNYVFA